MGIGSCGVEVFSRGSSEVASLYATLHDAPCTEDEDPESAVHP